MACSFNLIWFINRRCCGFCGCWQILLLYEAAAFCRWGVPASINGCLGHKQNFITDVIYLDWHAHGSPCCFPFARQWEEAVFLLPLKLYRCQLMTRNAVASALKNSTRRHFSAWGKSPSLHHISQETDKETWSNKKKGKRELTQIAEHLKSSSCLGSPCHKKHCGEKTFLFFSYYTHFFQPTFF